MTRMIGGMAIALILQICTHVYGEERPSVHPCTGDRIPLTSEKAVVRAIECLYDGQVAKVEKVGKGKDWYYRLRVLIPGGRIKNLDVDPETGLPKSAREREAVL